MKKKVLFVIFIFLVCFLFISCTNGTISIVKKNLSDFQTVLFIGEGENYYCGLSSGYRESEYYYNGISTSLVECGVVSLQFKDIITYQNVQIELEIDGTATEYLLELSPYENVFMCDIEKSILNNQDVLLNIKSQQEKIKLKCVSNDWKINENTALQIGTEYLNDKIKELYFNKKLNAECYLKPIFKFGYDKVFWYFSVINLGGDVNYCLIDVNTGKVL